RLVHSRRTLPQYGSFPVPPVPIGESVQGRSQQEGVFEYSGQSITETIPTSEQQRLSTRLTTVLKVAALAFWLQAIFLISLGPLVMRQVPPSLIPRLTITEGVVLLSTGLLTSFVGLYVMSSLRNVYLPGDHLLVSDRGKELKIHCFDIARVSGPDWTSLRRITIHLHRPSEFGKKIAF